MEPVWIVVAAVAALALVVVLVLLLRGKERVIDVGGGSVAADNPREEEDEEAEDAAEATGIAPAGAMGPGEVLEARGKDDAECGLADWLMEDLNRTLGGDYSTDRMVITRLADAALKASADLRATGRASIDLPYIAADASGPKNYRREVTRAEAELGMARHGALLADELIQWRGRDQRTVALAEWLEAEADEDAGSGSLDPAGTVRLADAAEKAMADIARTGHAVIDLPGLTREGGGARDFRREFDRETLEAMIGEA
jgi:hypothetical protein